MALNMQQKFVMVLEARGFVIVTRRKYIVMTKKDFGWVDGKPDMIYLGKSGSVRRGSTRANSQPITHAGKERLLAEFETLMPPGF